MGYLISIGMEPINPSRAAWAFGNRVITTPRWRELAGRFLAYPTASRKHPTNQPGT